MSFNVRKFVGDLIRGAEASEDIDPVAFGAVLIGALANQLGDGAEQAVAGLSRGQKAARTRKKNAARKANSGAGAQTKTASEAHAS